MLYSQKKLLSAVDSEIGADRQFACVRDVVDSDQVPESTAILRFDVERLLAHNLRFAQKLAHIGATATFYFHTRKACYDPEVLRQFADLGHEVGYHHECLDRCRGDFTKARDLFLAEVDIFRRDGIDLQTVCSHGEAGLPR